MSTVGTIPHLFRSAAAAWFALVGGLVAVLLGLVSIVVNLLVADPTFDWRAVVLLAFGTFAQYIGAGSLRGQHRDAVRRDQVTHPHP
ncbi:hypothetical protein JF66_14385 [Cryobacterium sp. MLB-32]|uniref:hypothetical protein n=1 Tax=Cryobacterium sp. MLB-32 TaxID=1529318 RepID=UPI0004E6EB4B|nr:hypothetical protein [Cryobacterium sp. MLB-32]KFF59006.1 hypothetical protein JF66_14385 [Cryobacterium sp. MLB-32]